MDIFCILCGDVESEDGCGCVNNDCELSEFTLTEERKQCDARKDKCRVCMSLYRALFSSYRITGHRHGITHRKCLDCGYVTSKDTPAN